MTLAVRIDAIYLAQLFRADGTMYHGVMESKTMRVTLPPKLAKIVKQQIASGRFRTAAEVIGEGLVTMAKQPLPANFHSANVQKKILEGINDLRAGRSTSHDKTTRAELLAEIADGGRKLLKKKAARA